MNNQTQHTQGKWRLGFRNKKSIVCDMPNGNIPTICECQVHLDNTNITDEEAIANAERIIKAVNILSILEEEVLHVNKFKDENLSIEGRYKKLYLTNLLNKE